MRFIVVQHIQKIIFFVLGKIVIHFFVITVKIGDETVVDLIVETTMANFFIEK